MNKVKTCEIQVGDIVYVILPTDEWFSPTNLKLVLSIDKSSTVCQNFSRLCIRFADGTEITQRRDAEMYLFHR